MECSYKVRLDNGKIKYIADYACKECRYASNDKYFFTEVEGNLYCSLHKERVRERRSIMLTKKEILEIIDTTANFNAYIEGLDTLNGQSLDLVMQVAGVDGEEWTDEECLEIVKEIIDMTNAYRNTHKWAD